jgi:multicomponent Na+:H+ antiporter subunit G
VTSARDVVDVLAMGLVLLGSLFSLTAVIGLLRFPDVLSRLHAATKPQVLGVLLVIVGVALRVGPSLDLGLLLLAAVFQLLTLPVAAHLVGRAVYRADQLSEDDLAIDELGGASPPAARGSGTG